MVTNDTKNKIRALHKKLRSEDIENLTLSKCNAYIQQLSYIKELLHNARESWVYNMEEIYEIQKAIFTEDYQEDIEESMNQLLEQIDLIATNVGLDEDSQEPSPKQDSNPMHINITNQNTNISMQSQVSNLYREFNEELDKPDPDKMKLKDIVSTIIKVLGLVL